MGFYSIWITKLLYNINMWKEIVQFEKEVYIFP